MEIIETMNLAAFDLNLLLVFDALMQERHVTRAGARIGLSQPAMSAALQLTLPHFSAVAKAVAESELIAALPERLACELAPRFGLAIRELPVELAPLTVLLYWHRRRDRDAAHAWLRQQLVLVAGEVKPV